MRHTGARESLPQRLADLALIADHERAHLGVFRIREIAIEEFPNVRPYRFNLARRKDRTMPDDLKPRRTERVLRRGHRRVNAVAPHEFHVIEFAGIPVVAWLMNPRTHSDFL